MDFTWFALDCSIWTNPKIAKLAGMLNVDIDVAVCKIARIWSWAMLSENEDGEVTYIPDDELAGIARWKKKPSVLVAALKECGFIDDVDGRKFLHGWASANGKYPRRKREDRERKTAGNSTEIPRRKHGKVCDTVTYTNTNNIPTYILPAEDEDCLRRLIVPDDAAIAHKMVADELIRLGYTCQNEYPVLDRGDGRRGRVDIYAQKGNCAIAIEIDRDTPREKSLYKLRQLKDCDKLIILRTPLPTADYSDFPIRVIALRCSEQNPAGASSLITDDIAEIVRHLNEKAGSNFRASTANTRKQIGARLKDGFTVEDCKRVIDDRCKRWKGTEQEQYLRPDTLFRPSKFEGYLNAAPKDTTDDWRKGYNFYSEAQV